MSELNTKYRRKSGVKVEAVDARKPIKFYATDVNKLAYINKAKELGFSELSGFIRYCVDSSCNIEATKLRPNVPAINVDVAIELGRQGNNFNQLLRHLNGGGIVDETLITQIVDCLNAIQDLRKKALNG